MLLPRMFRLERTDLASHLDFYECAHQHHGFGGHNCITLFWFLSREVAYDAVWKPVQPRRHISFEEMDLAIAPDPKKRLAKASAKSEPDV